jgi:hypothetical protein
MARVSPLQPPPPPPQTTKLTSSPLPVGCVPNSISPGTYISNFTGTYSKPADLLCAIAVTDDALLKKMNSACCKGPIKTDSSGCYHWCHPDAKDITDWATCIADNVYTDTDFGQACNSPGELALKSALDQHEKAPSGTTSGGGRLGAGWKVGVLVGVVALVQALC